MSNPFDEVHFQNSLIQFRVDMKPISIQNKNESKKRFKEEIQKITVNSKYIITNICWIAIDYYCKHIHRFKNPGVYDIDNIVKPILDSLVGKNGLLVDDVIASRVIVNWMDTQHEDFFEINIEYPILSYIKKSDLIFIKSNSGWCFPAYSRINQEDKDVIQHYFKLWDSIENEDDYYHASFDLPMQRFIYFNKIKDRGYTFIDLESY